MPTSIFNTQTLFQSGAFISGASAADIGNALSFASPYAYCLGPSSHYLNVVRTGVISGVGRYSRVGISSSLMTMEYLWRARYDSSSRYVVLERSVTAATDSFGGWTETRREHISASLGSGVNFNKLVVQNIDLSMDEYGMCYISLEITPYYMLSNNEAFLAPNHTSDVIIMSNSPVQALTRQTTVSNIIPSGNSEDNFFTGDQVVGYSALGADTTLLLKTITGSSVPQSHSLANTKWIIVNAKNAKHLWDGL